MTIRSRRSLASSLILVAAASLATWGGTGGLPEARAAEASAALMGPSVDFAPRPPAGYEKTVAVTFEMTNTMDGMGMGDVTSTIAHAVFLKEKVTQSSDQGATIEYTYLRAAYRGPTTMGDANFDTQNGAGPTPGGQMGMGDANATIGDHLKKLVGKKVTVKLDAKGRIASVDGEGDEGIPMVLGPLCGLKASPESFIMILGPIATMPADSATTKSAGDTWSRADAIQPAPGMNATLAMSYALDRADDASATVSGTGKLDPPAKPDAYTAMKVVRSEARADAAWDVKNRMPIGSSMDLRYTLSAGEGMTTKNRLKVMIARE